MAQIRAARRFEYEDDVEPECLECPLPDCRFTGSYAKNCPYLQAMRDAKKPPKPRPAAGDKRCISWALRNEDFSDLTVAQIAEVFGTSPASIHNIIRVLRKAGHEVQYVHVR